MTTGPERDPVDIEVDRFNRLTDALVASRTPPPPPAPREPGVFTRAELADPKFFHDNRAAILEAVAAGRIVDELPANTIDDRPTFTRSQLRDPAFYQANRAAIHQAAAAGRIVDDIGDRAT